MVLRSVATRPLRSALTLVAVALGIAVVLGVQIARAGLETQASQAVARQAGASSLDVRVDAGSGLTTQQVRTLAHLRGVLQAVPLYEKRVVAGPAGIGLNGLTVTLVGLQDGTAALRPVEVVSGRLPAPDSVTSVAIDRGLASALTARPGRELKLGDRIQLITGTGPKPFTVVGFTTGTSAGPAFTRSAVFVSTDEITSAFRLGLRTPLVALRLTAGAAPAGVASEVHQHYGQGVTAFDPRGGAHEPLADLQPLLALLTVLSVIVGAGVTANSVVLSVAERRREIGLLRAAGASARQVFRLFAAEVVVLAVLAVPFGIAAGIGLGAVLVSHFSPSDLPAPDFAVSAGMAVLAVVAGVGAAIVGGVVPALLAARTPVLHALRSHPAIERERPHPLPAALAVGSVVAAGICFSSDSDGAVALGAVLFLGGVAAALPMIVPLVTRGLGTIVSPLLDGTQNAVANLNRSRNRTALTAAGLSVSVATAVAVSALTAGALTASDNWVSHLFVGDVLVRSPVTQRDAVATAVRKSPGVHRATALRIFSEPVAGQVLGIAAIDPSAYQHAAALDVTTPDYSTALGNLEDGPVFLAPDSLAAQAGWQVGTQLPVPTLRGTTYFTVVGFVAHSYPSGDGGESVVMADDLARTYFGATASGFDALEVTSDGNPSNLDGTAASYGMQAVPVADIAAASRDSVQHSIGLLLALAIVSVTIAMLAVVNTLSVSVRAGTRELALLRAVGLSQRQALRRVLIESGLLAAAATLIGVVAGCVIALPMLRASASVGFSPSFGFPLETAVVLAAIVVLSAVVATIGPARIAVGRSILDALRHE